MNDLLHYYKQNNIQDYPKTKKGYPDMRHRYNKQQTKKIQDELQLKQENKRMKENVQQLLNVDSQEECIICCEQLNNNIAFLSCGHYFCVGCIMMHSRENNNCPMCRKQVCPKLVKKEKMPLETLNSIIHRQVNILRSERMGMNFNKFIKHKIMDMIRVMNPDEVNIFHEQSITKLWNDIKDEFLKTNVDIGDDIINWYNS